MKFGLAIGCNCARTTIYRILRDLLNKVSLTDVERLEQASITESSRFARLEIAEACSTKPDTDRCCCPANFLSPCAFVRKMHQKARVRHQ